MELFLVFASGIMSIGLVFIIFLRRPNPITETKSRPGQAIKDRSHRFCDSSVRYYSIPTRGGRNNDH